MTTSRVTLTVAAAAALLLLAGCAAGPTPTSPDPEPSVSATATPVGVPGSRVPIGCDAMVSAGVLEATMGAGFAVDDEPFSIVDTSGAIPIVAQSGMAECRWSSAGRYLTVNVLADGADFYATWAPEGPIDPQPAVTVGTDPRGYCDADAGACRVMFALDDYWVEVYLGVDGVEVSTLLPVIDDLAANLVAAGEPLPAWVSPATLPPTSDRCGSELDADGSIAAAAGGLASPFDVRGIGGTMSYIWFSVQLEAGLIFCGATAGDLGLNVSIAPGSEWYWDDLLAMANGQPIDVAGADRAISFCQPLGDGCVIAAVVEHSIVMVDSTGADGAALIEQVAPAVVARAAALLN